MYEFRALLDRFWVTRSGDKELYFTMKRLCPDYRHTVNELLGWNLIVNESVVKLEKVPSKAQPWMGIQEFQEPMDYCLLCALLLFLADMDDGEPFLLSSLARAVETYLSELSPVDWTRFSHRKALVRVLQYAQASELVIVSDGDSAGFSSDRDHEVLYENTGLSRHFPVHFGRDILKCRSIEDFEAFSREGEDTDRGRQRAQRQRVYRQLAVAPGLYRSDADWGDFEYIKNQRRNIEGNLDRQLCGELQIYKNGAFFLLSGDGERCGSVFPGARALSDVTLLLCGQLREKVLSGIYVRGDDDTVLISRREFRREVEECRNKWGNGWGSQLRAMSLDKIVQEVTCYMAGWMLLEERREDLLLYPGAGRFSGTYPASWQNGSDTFS